MTDDGVRERVMHVVRTALGGRLPHAEWDSLQHIEVMLAVEDEFDVIVPEEAFAGLRDAEDIVAYLVSSHAPH